MNKIMKRLQNRAENLLREILYNRDEKGNCNSDYWKQRFENLSIAEDAAIRSLFKQLREAEMISVSWADNYPYYMVVLANGLSYFDEIDSEGEHNLGTNYTNNFYGGISGVQIQQGSSGYQVQYNESRIDESKIKDLLQSLEKYDALLDDELGETCANKFRGYVKQLSEEVNTTKDSERMKSILNYMRELSVNVGGGVIATGIVQLITLIMG